MTEDSNSAAAAPQTGGGNTESSPGEMIRRARERARVSLEDLASQTKLARNTLDALERDDFSQQLEAVYVRGYYRKCAKVLGIPEKDLIDAYQARVSPKMPAPPSKLRLASGTELGSGSRLPVPMAIAAAVLAVIVCVFVWNILKAPRGVPAILPVPVEPPAATGNETPATQAEASADMTSQSAPVTGAGETARGITAAPLSEPAVAAAPAQTAAADKPPAAAAARPEPLPGKAGGQASLPAASGALTLSFVITSWARVDDSAGKTLLNGLMHAGDNQTLKGKPPFTVFLGNAPGVRVEFEGKPVDISKHIADNLTARFTVPR